MSAQPAPADDQATQDDQANRDALNELRDIGMRFARTVDAQREAAADRPEATPELTVAFDRIARTVRRTILLFQHLHDPARAARQRTLDRARILRNVEDAIHREAEGPRAERLRAELHERLDSPDLDDQIGHRPLADIISELRQDFGIDGMPAMPGLPACNPYKRRTPADIATLHARAAQPRATQTLPPLPPGEGRGEGPGEGDAAPPSHTDDPERFFRLIASPNGA